MTNLAAASSNHAGLTVPDVSLAISWYQSTFGFRLLKGPLDVNEDDSRLGKVAQAIYGVGFRHFRFAHMVSKDDVGLELFQFDTDDFASVDTANFEYDRHGFTHIGLTTPDIDAAVKSVRDNGGRVRTAVQTIDQERGFRIAYVQDPWGTVLELSSHHYADVWDA